MLGRGLVLAVSFFSDIETEVPAGDDSFFVSQVVPTNSVPSSASCSVTEERYSSCYKPGREVNSGLTSTFGSFLH